MTGLRNIVLYDTAETHENLLPLSYTRPVACFRLGIMTIKEKWMAYLPGEYSFKTVEYLQEKYEPAVLGDSVTLFINGSLLPDAEVAACVSVLKEGEVLTDGEIVLAFMAKEKEFDRLANLSKEDFSNYNEKRIDGRRLKYVFDVFLNNDKEIENDYQLLIQGRKSIPLSDTCTVIGDAEGVNGRPNIFIEEGAVVEGAILNVKNGPIYIGKDAEVMEGCVLRGPIALGEHSIFKMGAKIYGGTTIGPYCKIGGEIQNIVVFGYSNKAHDGYLGNAVVGEWCNIGAGTNASNLKNDYAKIRIWNYRQQRFMRTDLQFCGLIMGDHSKAGINCMFNTATVVGVGVNLHGAGFPRVFIPSFSEGSPEGGFTSVSIDKFMTTAQRVMSRRGLELNDTDREICQYIYDYASKFKGKA
ncbi:MAG: glucose-1-phosphate thymidylyltransferase [Muribaculaceae bacterium]|nr:glucose-1-phosphate thymidylyltransferase [Muribaculaceae bacterium]